MGRGKIQLERIENLASRQVTFSKRRNGLMKKAKDLSILCDVEVGVIVFSSTGRIYENATNGMKSMLERYNAAKDENRLLDAASQAKLWKIEADTLRRELEDLNNSHRQLLGHDLSELSIQHLDFLQTQLEISTKAIQARKEQIWTERIKELNQQEIQVHQENMELHRQFNSIRQQIADLHKKVYGRGNQDPVSQYGTSDGQLSIQLELSPAQ